MFDQTDEIRSEPTGRRSGHRFGILSFVLAGAVLVLVVAIAVALLMPIQSCACATPLDLVVQNYSPQDATVSWSQPGLFGTPVRGLSGGAVATRCRALSAGLQSGVVQVSVTTREQSRTFSLHVRDGVADVPAAIVIGTDGHIADPTYGGPAGGLRQDDALC